MRRILSQVSLVFLIIVIGAISVLISIVNATGDVSLSATGSVNVGDTITVTLGVPSDAYAAEATIRIQYSDGTSSSSRIAYVSGMDGFGNSTSFTAKVAGTATITATNIIVSDMNSNQLSTSSTTSTSVNIINPTPVTTSEPPVTTPTENENNKPNPEPEKPKEPEVVNPTFKNVKETVYVTTNCNVRSSCSSKINDNKLGGLYAGQEVTRTGISSEWSRILYNGGVAYVATRLLSTEKPEEDNTINEIANNTVNEILDENVSNELINQVPIEGEKTELEILQEEIGVLPEVGNNVAVKIYVIVTVIATVMASCGLYYIKVKRN